MSSPEKHQMPAALSITTPSASPAAAAAGVDGGGSGVMPVTSPLDALAAISRSHGGSERDDGRQQQHKQPNAPEKASVPQDTAQVSVISVSEVSGTSPTRYVDNIAANISQSAASKTPEDKTAAALVEFASRGNDAAGSSSGQNDIDNGAGAGAGATTSGRMASASLILGAAHAIARRDGDHMPSNVVHHGQQAVTFPHNNHHSPIGSVNGRHHNVDFPPKVALPASANNGSAAAPYPYCSSYPQQQQHYATPGDASAASAAALSNARRQRAFAGRKRGRDESSNNSTGIIVQEGDTGAYNEAMTANESPLPPRTPTGKKRSAEDKAKMEEAKAKRKKVKEEKQKQLDETKVTAKRAADLAAQTFTNKEVAKQLLLQMALVRDNPRSKPETLPGKGYVIPKKFFWNHLTPLENILCNHMTEYYELSTAKCQSSEQREFNNRLVVLVKAEATRQGWTFCSKAFPDDRMIRDRIRCFYKTSIQNSKKRLKTMVRNPTKRANSLALVRHLDLIEKHNREKEEKARENEGILTAVSPTGTSMYNLGASSAVCLDLSAGRSAEPDASTAFKTAVAAAPGDMPLSRPSSDNDATGAEPTPVRIERASFNPSSAKVSDSSSMQEAKAHQVAV